MDRVAEQLRRELGDLITRELKDPRVDGVSVTDVDVSPDLAQARVFVTSLWPDRMPEALDGLTRAGGFLRHKLARRVNLRNTPRLVFAFDDSELRASRLDALIESAREEDRHHGNE